MNVQDLLRSKIITEADGKINKALVASPFVLRELEERTPTYHGLYEKIVGMRVYKCEDLPKETYLFFGNDDEAEHFVKCYQYKFRVTFDENTSLAWVKAEVRNKFKKED